MSPDKYILLQNKKEYFNCL